MSKGSFFSGSIGEEPGLNDFAAEIIYKNEFFALITQEDGFDKLRINIQPRKNGEPWDIDLQDLLQKIEASKQRLWELREIK